MYSTVCLTVGLNVTVSYPILCVAVAGADDASSFLDHFENDTTVDVAHDVGVIWTHNPALKRFSA